MNINAMFSNRRAFLKWAAVLPTLGAYAVEDLFAKARKSVGRSAKANVYTRIGVTPIINARGTWTYISGSQELQSSSRRNSEPPTRKIGHFAPIS